MILTSKPSGKLSQSNQQGAVLVELLLIFGVLVLLIFATVILSKRSREHARLIQVNRAAGRMMVRQCGDVLRNDGQGLQECMQQVANAVFVQSSESYSDLTILLSAYNNEEQPSQRLAYVKASSDSPMLADEESRFSTERVGVELRELLETSGTVIIIESMTVNEERRIPFGGFLPVTPILYEVVVF